MANRVGPKAWTDNRLTSRLGLQYPIIQGPLGGLSSQRLTAAVSNYGGLGSFGAHGLEPEAIRKVMREIKGLTSKPFAMNLWVSMEDEGALTSTEEAFHRSLAPLAKHIESVEGAKPSYRPYEPIRFEDQVQVLLDEGISAFSFIYGIPSKQILDDFRRQGIVLIGTATIVDEAIALEQAGVDVIAASDRNDGTGAAGRRCREAPGRRRRRNWRRARNCGSLRSRRRRRADGNRLSRVRGVGSERTSS
jgi:nitronate monooxygenase